MAELPVLRLKLTENPVDVQLTPPAVQVEFSGLNPGGFLHQGPNPPQTGVTSKATVKFTDESNKIFYLANDIPIPPGVPLLIRGCPPDFH